MAEPGSEVQVLIVEDDSEMGELLRQGLVAEGYGVTLVENGVDALIASTTPYSLAVVDVMLPGMTGFELSRRLKQLDNATRILLLTARTSIADRVTGLDAGADDYLTKPFAFAELSARLRALLRRDDGVTAAVVTVGGVRLDSMTSQASAGGTPLLLSPKEFAVLRLLARQAGSLVTRRQLLEEVWGGEDHIDHNVVDQYASYVRRKLSAVAADVRITTVRGEGYRLEVVQ